MDVLAAIAWDPQIRGFLIFLTSLAILGGSVFMILATNVGARVGFLLSVAGLTGWMAMLGLLWTLTPSGTGPRGRDPRWDVTGVVTGDIGATARPPLDVPLERWHELDETAPDRAELQTAADEFFSNEPEGQAFGLGSPSDYIVLDSFERGGEREGPFGVLNFRPFNVFHAPHYAVVQLQPTVEQETVPGEAPPEPRADTSKPQISVLLVRDLGNVRLPVFLFFVSSSLLFAVTLAQLHRRDKIAMASRGALPAGAQ